MEQKGYQLIEPLGIDTTFFATPIEWQIPYMLWVVDLLNNELSVEYDIEIELIVAKYVNPYPCIGVHYHQPIQTRPDLEAIIENKIMQIFSLPFESFFKYVLNNQAKISQWINLNREKLKK